MKIYKWYRGGKLFRETKDPEGVLVIKEYHPNNVVITYRRSDSGILKIKIYSKNGRYHREDGPAVTYYHMDGSISRERYYHNGEFHRDGGPAVINYDKNGVMDYVLHYKKGFRISG